MVASFELAANAALVVIDVQQGFDDPAWGPRNNPLAEPNIASLIAVWVDSGRPIVMVRHDSRSPGSTLAPGHAGNEFKSIVADTPAAVLVTKGVNSAFLGEPDLHAWLTVRGIEQIVIGGIQTNMCCETTARMGGNLGYDVLFALDATHTFDRRAPDGEVIPADALARVTATNLDREFARVVSTADLVARSRRVP